MVLYLGLVWPGQPDGLGPRYYLRPTCLGANYFSNIQLQQQSIFQRIHLSNIVLGAVGYHIPESKPTRNIFRNTLDPVSSKNNVVSILSFFCVWTKSLMCNNAANRDSTFQSEVRRITKFPVSRPDNVSSRPDAHRSTVPSDGHQTDKHHLSGRRASSVWTPTSYREASVPACSIRTFQQHVRTPISSRTVH
jgi:hypothetical protein